MVLTCNLPSTTRPWKMLIRGVRIQDLNTLQGTFYWIWNSHNLIRMLSVSKWENHQQDWQFICAYSSCASPGQILRSELIFMAECWGWIISQPEERSWSVVWCCSSRCFCSYCQTTTVFVTCYAGPCYCICWLVIMKTEHYCGLFVSLALAQQNSRDRAARTLRREAEMLLLLLWKQKLKIPFSCFKKWKHTLKSNERRAGWLFSQHGYLQPALDCYKKFWFEAITDENRHRCWVLPYWLTHNIVTQAGPWL